MLQRILVAVVGIPLLLFVLIIAPDWATALLLCALCTVGAHELLAAACRKELCRRWWGLSAIMGVTVVLRTYLAGIGQDGAAALMEWLLAAWLVLLFVSVVVEYGTPRALAFRDVCTILMAGIAIPLAFQCLMQLRLMEHGGGLVMIGNLIRDQLLKVRDWNVGSAMSMILIALSAGIYLLYRKVGGDDLGVM